MGEKISVGSRWLKREPVRPLEYEERVVIEVREPEAGYPYVEWRASGAHRDEHYGAMPLDLFIAEHKRTGPCL